MRSYLAAVILLVSFSASAGDLASLKACVAKSYVGLSGRNGIVAAVLDADDIQLMTFGAAKLDQIFEIGSITKTFTANLLAQETGISLSDAIPAEYQKTGSTITYENLVTHTAGIPTVFTDSPNINTLSPFDGLTIPLFKTLYNRHPLDFPPGTDFNYSNMGESLIGLILAEKAGESYEQLVSERIFKVLGMNESYFEIPTSALNRFPNGRMIHIDGKQQEIPHWDLYKTAVDPAGGIRATIGDVAKYAQANLAPGQSPLADSIRRTQSKLYFIKKWQRWIGMNWLVEPENGLIWHNGETYGFNSILAMSTTRGQAVVAMTDTTVRLLNSKGAEDFDTWLQDVAFTCLK